MSADHLLAKFESLDLLKLKEAERLAFIVQVKAELGKMQALDDLSTDEAGQKIQLLKIWTTLAQLRVRDIQKDLPPPHTVPRLVSLKRSAQ